MNIVLLIATIMFMADALVVNTTQSMMSTLGLSNSTAVENVSMQKGGSLLDAIVDEANVTGMIFHNAADGTKLSDEGITVVRKRKDNSTMCLISRGKYDVDTVKPTCDNGDFEVHGRSCYPKCSLITKGKYPVRSGMTACSSVGCDPETEELWGGECVAKCSVLTDGVYPQRLSKRSCGLAKEDWHCGWYNEFACTSSKGWNFLNGCDGYYVSGNLKTCPYPRERFSYRSKYGRNSKKITRSCQDGEYMLKRMCYTIVPCPASDQPKSSSSN